jgi:serine/threonine protein kinase
MVLSDFGMHLMSRWAPVHDAESGVAYESPAVAAGEEQDTRRDIYAIGAVLYYCLTGQPPYSGTTAEEVRSKILSGPPKPIRDVQPKADSALARIAEKAMAREVRHCYADSAALEEALEGKCESGMKRFPSILIIAFLLVATALTSFWLGSAFRRDRTVPSVPVQYVSESITTTPAQPLIYPSLFPVPQLRVDGVEVTTPGMLARIALGWDHPEGVCTYAPLSSAITAPAQVEIILERSASRDEAPVEVGRFISPQIGEWVSPAPLEFKDRVEDPGIYSYQIKIRTQNAIIRAEHLRLKVELRKEE